MTTTRERTFLFCQTMTPSAAEGVSLCTLILAPEPHPPAGRTTTSRHGGCRIVPAGDRSFGQRTGPRNQTRCVGGTLLAVASLLIVGFFCFRGILSHEKPLSLIQRAVR